MRLKARIFPATANIRMQKAWGGNMKGRRETGEHFEKRKKFNLERKNGVRKRECTNRRARSGRKPKVSVWE